MNCGFSLFKVLKIGVDMQHEGIFMQKLYFKDSSKAQVSGEVMCL